MNLKEIEIQRQFLLEQTKILKFQERDTIEKILKKCIPSFVGLSWYDDNLDIFNVVIENFTISQILELNEELENWNINFYSTDKFLIQICFDRIKE